MSKRQRPAGRRLDPQDVLAGRVRPTAVELLDLIHRVNPTGRELPAREAELRYRQKARLQSLLVRSFAGEITVVPDPEREGTVSLLHRGRGRDACHAVIAELDEDARGNGEARMQVEAGASRLRRAEELPGRRAFALAGVVLDVLEGASLAVRE
jgi:hypothetical protein